MTRMRYLTAAELPEEHRSLIERNPGNLFRVLTHSPEGARHFARMGGWIRSRSTADGRLREMAILQVGYSTRQAYEWSHHVKIGRDFSVSDDDVRAIVQESGGERSSLPALERAVLRLAREMTLDGAGSESALNEVLELLGENDTMELVITIAYYNLVVRVLGTLDVDVEPSYEQYLEEFPLPMGSDPLGV